MAFIDQIDPELRPYLNSLPAIDLEALDMQAIAKIARAKPVAMPLVPHPDIAIRDDRLASSGARLRVFMPRSAAGNIPAFVYFHGGGFFTGSLEANDSLCQSFALAHGCAVVAVDYRKAPEDPYPAGFDDCYEALVWATNNGLFEAGAVAIGGISAGAAMAAGVALRARDEGGPKISGQILAIPGIDYRFQTASSRMEVDKRIWHLSLARKAWAAYLRDVVGHVPAYASPSIATDFSNLPPALITAEGEDILRDEAIEFAQNLMRAGIAVDLRVFAGAYHGSFAYEPEAEVSKAHLAAINSALERFLAVEA